jgi:hypothetical protein
MRRRPRLCPRYAGTLPRIVESEATMERPARRNDDRLFSDRPATYAIWVRGVLEPRWSERLGGMQSRTVRAGAQPMTELVGTLADQTALVGVLKALYDLGLSLISLDRLVEVEPDEEASSDEADAPGS